MKTSATGLAIATLAWLSSTAIYGANINGDATGDLLSVGTPAPEFNARSQSGAPVSLHKLHGKAVILYFYPKDETPGCTTEACTFRDNYNQLKSLGAEVIGVSADSDESHRSFAKNHQLPFTLVADSDDHLLQLFHVPKLHGTLHARVTYVIDKHGVIEGVFKDLPNAADHVSDAKALVEKINASK